MDFFNRLTFVAFNVTTMLNTKINDKMKAFFFNFKLLLFLLFSFFLQTQKKIDLLLSRLVDNKVY
jgi:hypothetical protein